MLNYPNYLRNQAPVPQNNPDGEHRYYLPKKYRKKDEAVLVKEFNCGCHDIYKIERIEEKWSQKYKKSINCSNPKGFSQKAHCQGRRKQENIMNDNLEKTIREIIRNEIKNIRESEMMTEEQFDEKAGKKDACYHKVKARYDVWPSAYASGALVKCRKVGAKNWGNKSKKESVVKEFGLPPTMQAEKQKLKNPKTGKMVTVASVMNQGTKTYPPALVKKAQAIYSAALERERATKKKLYGKSKYSFSGKKEGVDEGAMNWEKDFKGYNDKELKVISKFIMLNDKGIDGVIKMSKKKDFKPLIKKMAQKGLHEGLNEKKLVGRPLVKKAIQIAKKMSGNMTGAVKKIEKLKKGLSKQIEVEDALRKANEGFASDAQRRAAFASGYEEKGKKKKKKNEEALKESPAFQGAIHQAMRQMQKAKVPGKGGKPISMTTALKDKSQPAHKKAKGVLAKLVDKLKKKEKPKQKKQSKSDAQKYASLYGGGGKVESYDIFSEDGGWGYTMEGIVEAEYQGRKVKLGKPMQGDVKKFKVYVKNPKGNVVKVNFGQGGDAKGGTMRIRKSNPKARANFRARHNCDNPGPRHKARYWSCRKW